MSTPNAPREPLDELHAEIDRLRHQIAVKDAAIQVARDWLVDRVGGEEGLDGVLQMALECE